MTRKIFILILCVCLPAALQALVGKSINITSAGQLSSLLTYTELNTTTNLTVSGNIDARDFKIMRNSMPALITVNLSDAKIVSYIGSEGTNSQYTTVYPANEVPQNWSPTTITSIAIPSSATSLGKDAFSDCINLTSITIPSNVKAIENWAFSGCIHLASITIPVGVTSIGAGAFFDCSSLTSIKLPESIVSIGDGAFYGCNYLTTIAIPAGVTQIGYAAFAYCCSLESITIPGATTNIGEAAFYYCSKLTSITIPAAVNSIGSYAFWGCRSLTSIYAESMNPINLISSEAVFYGVNKLDCKLYVPTSSQTAYSQANQWRDFSILAIELKTTEQQKYTVKVINGEVVITGCIVGTPIALFTLTGVTIYNNNATTETVTIGLPSHGMYLVSVGKSTTKVVF